MKEVACKQCPLRPLPLFMEKTAQDVSLVQSLKRREAHLDAGETLIFESQAVVPLYTLLDGWAFRFKTLRDGRRQILNFLLPGDFIGVQQNMGAVATHGVMTLTAAVFCVFEPDTLWELNRLSPSMGFNVTWLSAQEESLVDEKLLSIGRRSAQERIASLLVILFKHAAALRLGDGVSGVTFPLTQLHIADALGLSLVHTNKTMRKLEQLGLHRIVDGRLHLDNPNELVKLADLTGDGSSPKRPLV